MTRRLNGEAREGDEETAEEVEAREGGLMERLKGRLRRRKKGPGIVKGGADGSEPGGRRLEGTNRLPEGESRAAFSSTSRSELSSCWPLASAGANFITPFVLDERDWTARRLDSPSARSSICIRGITTKLSCCMTV
jgi:hypothetical protein